MPPAGKDMDERRLAMLKGLIRSLPAGALRTLETALGLTKDAGLAAVRALTATEIDRRYVCEMVFQPFVRLFEPRGDDLEGVHFPRMWLQAIWNQLEAREPEIYHEAFAELRAMREDDPVPVVFFRLVKAGADLCRAAPQTVAGRDDPQSLAQVAELALYLDLHRIIRQTLARMPDFLGRIDAEKAAALRVMFKDAAELDAESGYRYLELIFANLEDGGQIIKFVATVSDRPKDRFLAESELAVFGERLLDHIEARVSALQQEMGTRHKPCEDLGGAGEHVAQALSRLQAFEHYVELSRDSLWGRRVAAAHKSIAGLVEQVLNSAEKQLGQVLPTRSERIHGRMKREAPDLDLAVAPAQIDHMRNTLAFIRDARPIAAAGGFSSLHNKVMQVLEAEMDEWFTSLLADANSGDLTDTGRATEAFERVAELMGVLCGEDKARTARRRVAASELFRPQVAADADSAA